MGCLIWVCSVTPQNTFSKGNLGHYCHHLKSALRRLDSLFNSGWQADYIDLEGCFCLSVLKTVTEYFSVLSLAGKTCHFSRQEFIGAY